MPSLGDVISDLEFRLEALYGRRPPVDSSEDPFAAMLGTVLSRDVDGRKAHAYRDALRDAGLIASEVLASADRMELVETLRHLGVNPSARWLGLSIRLARWFVDRAGLLEELTTERLRDELLAIPGLGPATTDAILLEVFRRPTYPIDRATYRILARHGWIDEHADYDEARATIEDALGENLTRLRSLSEWFRRVGVDFCRARTARCERCPLRSALPEGGPIEPEGLEC